MCTDTNSKIIGCSIGISLLIIGGTIALIIASEMLKGNSTEKGNSTQPQNPDLDLEKTVFKEIEQEIILKKADKVV